MGDNWIFSRNILLCLESGAEITTDAATGTYSVMAKDAFQQVVYSKGTNRRVLYTGVQEDCRRVLHDIQRHVGALELLVEESRLSTILAEIDAKKPVVRQ